MVGGGDKDRIKINHIYPQPLQIVQLIPDPLQITAVEIPHIHGLRPAVPVLHSLYMLVNIAVFSCHHIIGRIAIAEAVHKYLVHHRAFCPFRCLKARHNAKGIMRVYLPHHAHPVVITVQFACIYLKIIPDCLSAQGNVGFIIVKSVLGISQVHYFFLILVYQIDQIHIVFLCADPHIYNVSRFRFKRCPVIFCLITEHRTFIESRTHVRHILLNFLCILHIFVIHNASSPSFSRKSCRSWVYFPIFHLFYPTLAAYTTIF